ncbi:hypothetical protein ACROYT_G010980 [Oculina patagonica]
MLKEAGMEKINFSGGEPFIHKRVNIQELGPVRWKVFQCLLVDGENCGTDALRHAEKFVIFDEDFSRFVERHSKLSCLVPESNEKTIENPDHELEDIESPISIFDTYFSLSPTQLETRSELDTL